MGADALASTGDTSERTSSGRNVGQLLHSDVFLPLWVMIATYSSPRSMCDLEALTKPLRETLTSAQRSGSGPVQRYWHARCFVLRWSADTHVPCALANAPEDERKRRLLLYALTKPESKKCWKKEFQEEYEAYLRRNLRGMGVVNKVALREMPVVQLSTPIVPPPTPPAASPVFDMEDDAFAQMCIEGGLSVEHFTSRNGSSGLVKKAAVASTAVNPDEPTRKEYRKDKTLGKRKGKHGRGQVAVWETWVREEGGDEE